MNQQYEHEYQASGRVHGPHRGGRGHPGRRVRHRRVPGPPPKPPLALAERPAKHWSDTGDCPARLGPSDHRPRYVRSSRRAIRNTINRRSSS